MYLRNGTYFLDFWVDGVRIQQPTDPATTSKKEAVAQREALRTKQKARGKRDLTRVTLLEAMERYGDDVIAKGTGGEASIKNYAATTRKLCADFGADTWLDDITTKRIADWQSKMGQGGKRVSLKGGKRGELTVARKQCLAPGTINSYTKILRTVLRLAHRKWAALEQLPFIELVKDVDGEEGEVKFMTVAQEKQILAASPIYVRQFLQFLLGTGARKAEAFQLVWANVFDLQSNAPQASVQFQHAPHLGRKTKTATSRTIELPRQVRELLVSLRQQQLANGLMPEGEQPVFMWKNQHKKWQPLKTITTAFENARERAGLDWVTIHMMRHTYAVRIMQAGGSIYDLRDLLGHKSVKTTEIYTKFAPLKTGRTVALLDAA